MGRRKNHLQLSLQLARSARYKKDDSCPPPPAELLDVDAENSEECDWDGTVNYYPSSDSDSEFGDDACESEESEYSELEEEDLVQVLQAEIEALSQPLPYDEIMGKLQKTGKRRNRTKASDTMDTLPEHNVTMRKREIRKKGI